jgi:hypothetical protein
MIRKLLPIFATLLLAILAVFASQAEASKGPVITNKVLDLPRDLSSAFFTTRVRR